LICFSTDHLLRDSAIFMDVPNVSGAFFARKSGRGAGRRFVSKRWPIVLSEVLTESAVRSALFLHGRFIAA